MIGVVKAVVKGAEVEAGWEYDRGDLVSGGA
jgi:hypothetical protein